MRIPGAATRPRLPVDSYGEDIPFWIDAAVAARDDFDGWARRHLLDPPDHASYLSLLGKERLERLRGLSDPESWRLDAEANPLPEEDPVSEWEVAACLGAREVQALVAEHRADAVLAGAGVANLAAWVAVARERLAGRPVCLTAELGLWDYTPTPADPYIFNHRVFPGTTLLADASTVLGMVVGGPGTRTIGCLGAAEIDRFGNVNSTELGDGRFLVGSGGGNDVMSRATACVVVTLGATTATPRDRRLHHRTRGAGDQRGDRPRSAPPTRRAVADRRGAGGFGLDRGSGPRDGRLLWMGRRSRGRSGRARPGHTGRGARAAQLRSSAPVLGLNPGCPRAHNAIRFSVEQHSVLYRTRCPDRGRDTVRGRCEQRSDRTRGNGGRMVDTSNISAIRTCPAFGR